MTRYYYDPRMHQSVDGYSYMDIYMDRNGKRLYLTRIENNDWWKILQVVRRTVDYLNAYHSRIPFLTRKKNDDLYKILDIVTFGI